MSDDRSLHLKRQLVHEIWEELASLEGRELDEYLIDFGLHPDILLENYEKALNAARSASKRNRFEAARRRVHQKKSVDIAKILSFDLAQKKAIMNAIRVHAAKTHDMTIAARNQKIDDEKDLDSFLEACVRLGLIDASGNLQK